MPTKRKVNGVWNGKWVARVTVDGKSHYNGVNHPTKTAARQAEDEKRAELRAQPKVTVETIDSFALRWVHDYPRKANSTNDTNRGIAKRIAKEFEGLGLDDLDRPRARRWALTVPVSTVRVASAMFTDAMNDGLATANPFSNLRLEQSRGRKDIEVVTDAQLAELADLARKEHGPFGERFAAYLLVAAYTCMRPGEINAVCWPDVDFDAGEIRVSANIEAPTGFVKWPKNGEPRTIVLPPLAREALRLVPRSVDPVMIRDLRFGDGKQERPFDLIFRGKRGGKLTEPKLLEYWRPVRAAFRVKYPGSRLKDIYELRHKGATMLVEMGLMASDVAVQLGHTDGGKLVMERYGHPSEKLARDRIRQAWAGPVQLDVVRDAKEQAG